MGTECSSEVHGAQERPLRPGGRPQAGLCPGLSTGPSGRPQGSLRAPPPVLGPAGFCPLPCKTDPTLFSSSTLGHTPLLFQKVGRA